MNLDGVKYLSDDELYVFKKIINSVNKTSGNLKNSKVDLKSGDGQSIFRIMDALEYYGYKTNLDRSNGNLIISVEKRAN